MPLFPASPILHSSSSSKSENSSTETMSATGRSFASVPFVAVQPDGTGVPLYPRQPARLVPSNSGRQAPARAVGCRFTTACAPATLDGVCEAAGELDGRHPVAAATVRNVRARGVARTWAPGMGGECPQDAPCTRVAKGEPFVTAHEIPPPNSRLSALFRARHPDAPGGRAAPRHRLLRGPTRLQDGLQRRLLRWRAARRHRSAFLAHGRFGPRQKLELPNRSHRDPEALQCVPRARRLALGVYRDKTG